MCLQGDADVIEVVEVYGHVELKVVAILVIFMNHLKIIYTRITELKLDTNRKMANT